MDLDTTHFNLDSQHQSLKCPFKFHSSRSNNLIHENPHWITLDSLHAHIMYCMPFIPPSYIFVTLFLGCIVCHSFHFRVYLFPFFQDYFTFACSSYVLSLSHMCSDYFIVEFGNQIFHLFVSIRKLSFEYGNGRLWHFNLNILAILCKKENFVMSLSLQHPLCCIFFLWSLIPIYKNNNFYLFKSYFAPFMTLFKGSIWVLQFMNQYQLDVERIFSPS